MRKAAFIISLFLISCGGGGGGSSNPINISGRFAAVGEATSGTALPVGTNFELRFTLSQAGNTFQGTIASETGVAFQVSGTVNGNVIEFVVMGPPSCPGSFEGLAVVSDDSNLFEGRYSGSDCSGTIVADFLALREL